jgi:hypothetical protein
MHILDQNWTTTTALAAAITRHLPPLLTTIEAERRMRMSSWSVPSSSCSRRTPTLSHHRRPSPEKPPCRCEPQPPSTESFAALGEHPHDPLSILPFSLSRLVHQSALGAMLWRAALSAMAPSGFPYRTAVGRARADLHRPFVDRWLRLEHEDTPSRFKSWPKIWEPMALI